MQFLLKNKLVFLLLLLSFVGFLTSSYLTAEHYLDKLPACTILNGCEEVAKSKYSMIGPIPLSLLGVGYFLGLLILFVLYLDIKKFNILKLALFLTIPGLFVSLILIWLQYSVIKAWCIYCLAADITTILIFITGVVVFLGLRKKEKDILRGNSENSYFPTSYYLVKCNYK